MALTLFRKAEIAAPADIAAASLRSDRFRLEREVDWQRLDAIVAALGIGPDDALLTFQSRFGREPWLQPYTDKTLQALAAQGVKRVDVVCPGFAVDCLETLEEITVENAHLFREAGGETLRYIPCLNASPAHAEALAALARRHLRGAA